VRLDAGRRRVGLHWLAVRGQEAVGGESGVQVEVHRPCQGCLPDIVGQIVGGGGGVVADQVVHRVPAVGSSFDQGRLLQGGQCFVRAGWRQGGEGDHGGQGGVGAGGDAHQSEQGALGVGEVTQRPGQHGGQAGGEVVGVECVQAEVAQVGDEVVEQVGVGADTGGDQTERQRESVAQADQFGDRPLGVGGGVIDVAEGGGEQGAGFGVGEYVEVVAVFDDHGKQARCSVVDHVSDEFRELGLIAEL
jgi:hypothetical protein